MTSRFSPKARIQVRTVSGQMLGRVIGIDVEEETGRIVAFFVSGPGVLPMLLDQGLIIAWNQVVEWTNETLTVLDAVVPAGASQIAMSTQSSTPSAQFSDRV